MRAMLYIHVIMLVLVCCHCSVRRISPGYIFKIINFLSVSLVSGLSIQKRLSTREQVLFFSNWRKLKVLNIINFCFLY